MKLAEVDWPLLRGALAGLTVCLVVAGLVAGASYEFVESKRTALRVEKSKLLGIRGKYQTIDEEERLIEEYLPRFVALEERGVIGREFRLDWIETLRGASTELKLPELRYAIDTQDGYQPDFPVNPGAFQIYASKMRLDLGLLHEGDLPALLERIERDARGLYRVSDCALTRTASTLDLDPTKPNVRANCTLDWLTVRRPDPEQPA